MSQPAEVGSTGLDEGETKAMSKPTLFALTGALAIHEFIEGIAFGLMDEKNFALWLGVGIFVHKVCAGLSIGAGFAKTDISLRAIVLFSFGFSLVTPIGIATGMSVQSMAYPLVTVVFYMLSAGTFIYVACSAILKHEFENSQNSFFKLLMVLIGAVVIGVLWFLANKELADVPIS